MSTPASQPPAAPSRRAIAKGAAWSAPVLATAAAAPTYASSPYVCTPNAVMDWGAARDQLPSGTVYTIAGTQTIYAVVTHVTTAATPWSTGTYHLDIGKTAWGRVTDATGTPPSGVTTYTLNPTGGGNDLILNQQAEAGNTKVTISFFKNAALTQPHYVSNLQVPLDDFSAQRSYSGIITPTLNPAKSYQEMWQVSGASAGGAVTPVPIALQSPYSSNPSSTLANVAGSGTAASPWNFPVNLASSSRNSVGGNLITRFSVPVNSVTVTYGSSTTMTGPQAAGLGRLTMCA